MAVLCGMFTIQYSAGSGPLSVHKLFTSCIRRCLVSRACDWVTSALSVMLLIFIFQFSLFSSISVSQAAQLRTWFAQYRTSDIAENLDRFLYGAYSPGKWFWINSNGKMETRYPLEGSFGSEFSAICNYCVVLNFWRPKVARRWNFVRNFCFFGKTTHYAKIFKILFRKFSSRNRSPLLCSNVVQFVWREIGEIMRYVVDKKFACLSDCRYYSDRAQNLPGPAPAMYSECSRFHPNRFTFGGVIAERVNTAKLPRKVNPIFGRSLASSRITTFVLHFLDSLVLPSK